MNVFLTDDAYDGWRSFAERNGLSVTAALEALGRVFVDDPDTSTPLLRSIIVAGRRIDAERRDRRQP